MTHDVPPREQYFCKDCKTPTGQASYDNRDKQYIITCVKCNLSTFKWDTLGKCHEVWDRGCRAG
jgi:RNase P subunit RPR2